MADLARLSAPASSPELAAIFPEVVRQKAKSCVIRRVVVKSAFGSSAEQGGVQQALQVMAQGRGWDVHVSLNVSCSSPGLTGLDDKAQRFQSHGMAQSR